MMAFVNYDTSFLIFREKMKEINEYEQVYYYKPFSDCFYMTDISIDEKGSLLICDERNYCSDLF